MLELLLVTSPCLMHALISLHSSTHLRACALCPSESLPSDELGSTLDDEEEDSVVSRALALRILASTCLPAEGDEVGYHPLVRHSPTGTTEQITTIRARPCILQSPSPSSPLPFQSQELFDLAVRTLERTKVLPPTRPRATPPA